jgi:hypothetical protein
LNGVLSLMEITQQGQRRAECQVLKPSCKRYKRVSVALKGAPNELF